MKEPDGGKLHGGLKMLGTGPEPESFDVPPVAAAAGRVEGAEAAEDASPDEEHSPDDASPDGEGQEDKE